MKKTLIILLVTGFCLISLGVFYRFLIEPIYLRHKLSSCLDKVDRKFSDTKDRACKSQKEDRTYSCLLDAQVAIYCKDESNRIYNKSSDSVSGSGALYNLWENISPYSCNAPDNSNGYWNDNSEYRELAIKCEEKITNESCKLSDDYVQSLINSREKERNFCFKQF